MFFLGPETSKDTSNYIKDVIHVVAVFFLRSGTSKGTSAVWMFFLGRLTTHFHEDVLFESLDFQSAVIYLYIYI